jgi:hypothetical protein
LPVKFISIVEEKKSGKVSRGRREQAIKPVAGVSPVAFGKLPGS